MGCLVFTYEVVVMRIENVDIDVILGTENKGIYGAHEKEKKGFFKKLFDKEDAQEEYFKDRVQEIGRGELEKELSGEIDAYLVEKADPKNTVILTENYFILPGKELFPLYMIKEFALGSEWMPPYQQYAADRFGIPYDPDYKSEYEDEEGFELDRFNVEFIIHEEENGVIIHSFPMEIEDRKDFRQRLLDRCIADDLSDEGVFEGKFNEEKSIRELFY